jgi:hypothetical protein
VGEPVVGAVQLIITFVPEFAVVTVAGAEGAAIIVIEAPWPTPDDVEVP